MTDVPIIFSGEMVRALLDGSKRMTRRLAWRKPSLPRGALGLTRSPWCNVRPGDRLWVRENFRVVEGGVIHDAAGGQADVIETEVEYAADRAKHRRGWKPSIHLPRTLSRLTLIVEAVKIERLQAITIADVIAEGMSPTSPIGAFAELWDRLHGVGAWASNPEVVAMSFRVVAANIDTLTERAAA